MKMFLTLLLTFCWTNIFPQKYCDCDSIKGKFNFTDYCAEYLDLNLKAVSKEKARLKNFVFYFQGKKVSASPLLTAISNPQIYSESRQIISGDSLTILNGIYIVKDKKGQIWDELFFDNGFCKKTINWYSSKHFFYIAEYDYSYKPFNMHVIGHKWNSDKIKFNTYSYYSYGNWYYEESTTNSISLNLTDFNGVPPKK